MRRYLTGISLSLLVLAACSPAHGSTVRAAATRTSPTATTTPSTTSPTPTPTPTPTPSPAPPAVSSPAPSPAAHPAVPATAPVVVLDPGHNGGNAAHPAVINAPVPDGAGGTKPCNTTGTATNAGYPEHAFTWDVALRVRDRLKAAGVAVVLSRPDDAGVGPCVDVRGELSARVGAAAFVGIHGDGAAPGGRGFHVITSSLAPAGPQVAAASTRLATTIRDAMTAVEPVSSYLGRNGLDARSDLAGLNLNKVPAIYVECGNMRNATDAALMSSPAGRDRIAAQLAAGILAFLGR